ncbi:hypothetical protein PTI98_007164 [Pleurotus ostreatus]|nr:hypothetical protein PTI98_007164 [Pleurotus ostreatus]
MVLVLAARLLYLLWDVFLSGSILSFIMLRHSASHKHVTDSPNRSKVDDINLGLQHFCDDFDFVHARLISSGIKDFPALIHEILSFPQFLKKFWDLSGGIFL